MSGALLVRALAAPESTVALDARGWQSLLSAARAELLLASLADRLEGQRLPAAVAAILADARRSTDQAKIHALWEVEMARRALAPLGIPVVLLKGSAFAASGLDAARGRSIGDLDILVPRRSLDQAEAALFAAGWEWVKDDPYDQLYYRTWMHELPPMIHRTRDRMIDVHHTILPLTARARPDAEALIADGIALPGGALRMLSPADIVVHAACHLFADGDCAGGLRNLWDIDRLVRQFSRQPGYWEALGARAVHHDMLEAVGRSLRLASNLYGTPVDPHLAGRSRISDRLFIRRLLARDGWGRATRPATRFGFYLRGHAMRMPPAMLMRHLAIKAGLSRPPAATR